MKRVALVLVLCSFPTLAGAHAGTVSPRAGRVLSPSVLPSAWVGQKSNAEECTHGYDPCIPPGPDVDCAGGSGNGPRYVEGPVHVTGSDPYGLDRDGDGVGCE